MRFFSVYVVQPNSSTNMAKLWKKSYFILSEW